MPGIGVISNRNARLNKLHPELKEQLAYVIGSDGEVASTKSLDDAYKAAELFKKTGIDMIAISGGDGTAHRTMEILIEVYGQEKLPPILLLPTGTQNMVPRSFGIHGSGLANLLLAVMKYRHNIPMRCIKRNLLSVNGHLSFMFGLGIAVRFLAAYYEAGETNPKGAAKLLTKLLGSIAVDGKMSQDMLYTVGAKLISDGEELAEKLVFHTLFCSFIERLPLHFVVFPEAGCESGVFQLVSSGVSPSVVAKQFPLILGGYRGSLKGIERKFARDVKILLDSPEAYTLDGEIYPARRDFEITAGPEIDFVVPALSLKAEDENLRYSEVGPWRQRFLL